MMNNVCYKNKRIIAVAMAIIMSLITVISSSGLFLTGKTLADTSDTTLSGVDFNIAIKQLVKDMENPAASVVLDRRNRVMASDDWFGDEEDTAHQSEPAPETVSEAAEPDLWTESQQETEPETEYINYEAINTAQTMINALPVVFTSDNYANGAALFSEVDSAVNALSDTERSMLDMTFYYQSKSAYDAYVPTPETTVAEPEPDTWTEPETEPQTQPEPGTEPEYNTEPETSSQPETSTEDDWFFEEETSSETQAETSQENIETQTEAVDENTIDSSIQAIVWSEYAPSADTKTVTLSYGNKLVAWYVPAADQKAYDESIGQDSFQVVDEYGQTVTVYKEYLNTVYLYYYADNNDDHIYFHSDMSHAFQNMRALKDISGLKYIRADYVQNTSYMFAGDESLTDISGLKAWNMYNLNNASCMFMGCSYLYDVRDILNEHVYDLRADEEAVNHNAYMQLVSKYASVSESPYHLDITYDSLSESDKEKYPAPYYAWSLGQGVYAENAFANTQVAAYPTWYYTYLGMQDPILEAEKQAAAQAEQQEQTEEQAQEPVEEPVQEPVQEPVEEQMPESVIEPDVQETGEPVDAEPEIAEPEITEHTVATDIEGQGSIVLTDNAGNMTEQTTYQAGSTVYFSMAADEGYFIKSINVICNSGEVNYDFYDNNLLSFVMPEEDVTITAMFMEKETEAVQPEYVCLLSDEDLESLQAALILSGLLKDSEDGYGEATYNAVVEFQTANGLEADGIADEELLHAVMEAFMSALPDEPENEEETLTDSEDETTENPEDEDGEEGSEEDEENTKDDEEKDPEIQSRMELYANEDFSTIDLIGLDFSAKRLIVLTGDESIFPEQEAIISAYNGVYLLQFDDVDLTKAAYGYFYDKADLVEPDVKSMSVDTADEYPENEYPVDEYPVNVYPVEEEPEEDPADEELFEDGVGTYIFEPYATDEEEETWVDTDWPVDDPYIPEQTVMSEEDNPLTVLEETVQEQPAAVSYDIALIDTGAAVGGNVISAVSMLGDDGSDDNGHGTEMVSFITEQNPDARILSIKALDSNGNGDKSAVYAAFEYAMTQDVKIINLSASAFMTMDNSVIAEEIRKAAQQGIIVVGSAGNKNSDVKYYIPGSVEEAYIIGACDNEGNKIHISNYGETVDYNVTAHSTSEAAAVFTGWVSANGLEHIAAVLDQELIFTPSQQNDDNVVHEDDEFHADAFNWNSYAPNPLTPTKSPMVIEYTGGQKVTDVAIEDGTDIDDNSVTDNLSSIFGTKIEKVFKGKKWKDGYALQSRTTTGYKVPIKYIEVLPGFHTYENTKWIFYCKNYDLHVELKATFSENPQPVAYQTSYDGKGVTVYNTIWASYDAEHQIDGPELLHRADYPDPKFVGIGLHIDVYKHGTTDRIDLPYIFDYLSDIDNAQSYRRVNEPYNQNGSHIYIQDKTLFDANEYVDEDDDAWLNLRNKIKPNGDIYSEYIGTSKRIGANGNGNIYAPNEKIKTEGTDFMFGFRHRAGSSINYFSYIGGVTFQHEANNAPGELTIHKTVEPTAPSRTFTFTVEYGPTRSYGTRKVVQISGNGGRATVSIPAGNYYKVTESDYSSEGFRTYVAGADQMGTWPINYSEGNVVTGRIEDGQATSSRTYQYRVDGLPDDVSFKWYADGSYMGTVSNGGTVTAKGNDQTITIKHIEPGHRVKITPIIQWATTGGSWDVDRQTVIVEIPARGYADAGEVIYTYTAGGQTVEYLNNPPGSVTFSQETVVNPGKLNIKKEVIPTTNNKSFAFLLETGSTTSYGTNTNFTLQHGNTFTQELPAGTYFRITETDYSSEGYETKSALPPYPYTTGRVLTGQIPNDTEGMTYTFKVTGLPAGSYSWYADNVYKGKVANNGTVTSTGNETISIMGIPDGTRVTVTDVTPTRGNGTWMVTQIVGATVTAGANTNIGTFTTTYTPNSVNAKYQNEAPGELKISKSVVQSGGSIILSKVSNGEGYHLDASRQFTFTLRVTNASGTVQNGPFTYTGTVNGAQASGTVSGNNGTIKLRGGDSVTISGIPQGYLYTITETEHEYYVTKVTQNSGTKRTARVVNGTIPTYGAGGTAFEFTVTFSNGGTYRYEGSKTGTITSGGKITLTDGQEITIKNIPKGVTYTVTETTPTVSGGTFKSTGSPATGIMTSGATLTAPVTNTFTPTPQTVLFENTVKPAYAKARKVSANPTMTNGDSHYTLEGAQIGLYATYYNAYYSMNPIAILTTDADGNTTKQKIVPWTTYYVREISPSRGYKLDDTIYEVQAVPNATGEATITEPPYPKTKVAVRKYDDVTNLPLSTAEFTLYEYSLSAGHKYVETAKLNANINANGAPETGIYSYGYIYASEDNPLGKYVIDETGIPDKYASMSYVTSMATMEEVPWSTGEVSIGNTSNFVQSYAAGNTHTVIEVRLYKDCPTTDEVLSHCKFNVYEFNAAQSDYLRDRHYDWNTKSYVNGPYVMTWVEDTDSPYGGYYTTEVAYTYDNFGMYMWEEIEAQDGYELANPSYGFFTTSISEFNSDYIVIKKPLIDDETHYEGKVKLLKRKSGSRGTSTEPANTNAVFKVYEWNKETNAYDTFVQQLKYLDGYYISPFNLKAYMNPRSTVYNGGKYKIVEEETPDGLLMGTGWSQEFVIPANETVTELSFTVNNQVNKYNIEKYVYNSEIELNGVTFTFSDGVHREYISTGDNTTGVVRSGCGFSYAVVNGKIYLEEINPGTYTYWESNTPSAYKLDPTIYSLSVAEDGMITVGQTSAATHTQKIYNKPAIQLHILKTEPAATQNTLNRSAVDAGFPAGTTFSVYEWNTANNDWESSVYADISYDGTKFVNTATGQFAELEYTESNAGRFKVVETAATEGYILDNSVREIRFSVEADGSVAYSLFKNEAADGTGTYSNYVELRFENIPNKVTVFKEDEAGNVLGGATFTITNLTTGTTYTGTSNAEGYSYFYRLPEGSYKLIETDAPDNFIADDTIYRFTVGPDHKISVQESGSPVTTNDITVTIVNARLVKVRLTKQDATNGAYSENITGFPDGTEFMLYEWSEEHQEYVYKSTIVYDPN